MIVGISEENLTYAGDVTVPKGNFPWGNTTVEPSLNRKGKGQVHFSMLQSVGMDYSERPRKKLDTTSGINGQDGIFCE